MSLNYMKLEKEFNLTNEDNIRLEQHLSRINSLLDAKSEQEGVTKVKQMNEDNFKLKESMVILNKKIDQSNMKCGELEEQLDQALKEGSQYADERKILLNKVQKFASLSALKTEECEEKTLQLSKALISLSVLKLELVRVSRKVRVNF